MTMYRGAVRLCSALAIVLLAFAFVAGSADAQQRTITSLPYTVTSADNGYTLTLASSRMTTSGRAITFNGGVHDVVLDLADDTLIWGTAGNAGEMGIFLAGNPVYNVTIRGGYVLHQPPASATVPSNLLRAQAVRLGGGNHDILIDNVYFRVAGRNSQIIRNESGGNPGTYNVEIRNCRFDSRMESFTSREMWIDAAMVALGNNDYKDGAGFNYHFKIHNNTTINAHWCNLYLQGSDLVAEVYDNFLISDARNDLGTGFPTSAAQCYPLAFRGGGGTSRVDCYNNTIRSGTSYGGGRGIFISGIDGAGLEPHNSVYIHDNDIEVHQGYDGEEHTLNGILVRQGWTNIYLRNNTITCIGDTDAGTSSFETGPLSCLRLTGYGEGLKIVGNTLRAYFTTPYSPDYSMTGPFGACIMFDEFQMNLPNIVIDSNVMETDNIAIRWGFFNGQGGNVMLRDNVYRYINGGGDYVFYLGYGAGGSHHAYGNIDMNGVFLDGASPNDIYVDNGEPDSLSITLKATVQVNAVGNNALPVRNATVTVVNAYGQSVGSGLTNSNGEYDCDVSYRYEANDTFSGGDSTSFNDFRITVRRSGDSTMVFQTVSPTSRSFDLTLQNTAGEPGDSTVDLNPVGNLAASPGTNPGTIQLTWTAPGTGGFTAASYDIRYASSQIVQATWGAAQQAQGEPTPAVGGSPQSFTLTGLNPGQTYFVALKYSDGDGNIAPVSNSPSAAATGGTAEDITPPDPILDLGATCGDDVGTLLLTWTAPGDDHSSGTATGYDFRYSASPINSGNFSSAQTLANPPAPLPAGSPQEWSLNLPGGDTLYFAARAYDEEDNMSSVGDDAQLRTDIIRTPTADTVFVDAVNRIVTLVVDAYQNCVEVDYQFQIDTSPGFGTAQVQTDTEPDSFARTQFTGLLDNTVYYWRCRAVAAGGGSASSSYSTTRSFMPFVDLGTGCSDLIVLDPSDGDTVISVRPSLTVQNMNDETANVYFFEVTDQPDFADLVAGAAVNQQAGGVTSWTIPYDLDQGTTYRWRVRANDCDFTDPQVFFVAMGNESSGAPVTTAYPNPFKPSLGTPLTFSHVPLDNSLTIMTVSGSVVRHWDNVVMDLEWDGTNESGNAVSSGLYMWFAEPSGKQGKVIVVR